MGRMAGNVRSALVAGAIAFVIYVVIDLLTGDDFGSALLVGLVFFVITAVVTFAITLIVRAVRTNKRSL